MGRRQLQCCPARGAQGSGAQLTGVLGGGRGLRVTNAASSTVVRLISGRAKLQISCAAASAATSAATCTARGGSAACWQPRELTALLPKAETGAGARLPARCAAVGWKGRRPCPARRAGRRRGPTGPRQRCAALCSSADMAAGRGGQTRGCGGLPGLVLTPGPAAAAAAPPPALQALRPASMTSPTCLDRSRLSQRRGLQGHWTWAGEPLAAPAGLARPPGPCRQAPGTGTCAPCSRRGLGQAAAQPSPLCALVRPNHPPGEPLLRLDGRRQVQEPGGRPRGHAVALHSRLTPRRRRHERCASLFPQALHRRPLSHHPLHGLLPSPHSAGRPREQHTHDGGGPAGLPPGPGGPRPLAPLLRRALALLSKRRSSERRPPPTRSP